jgi:uncharacterized RDD family membrane protein YckC
MSSPIVTPEGVALSLEPAGLGSRFIATLIDSAIQLAILIPASIIIALVATAGIGGDVVLVGSLLLWFFVIFGYFPLFEGLWDGRTPGKRALRLRVIQKTGQPARLTHVLVRNLVRLIDFLPGMYSVGAITMIITKNQRLGDLAGGTIVVKEVPAPVPTTLPALQAPRAQGVAGLDISGLTDEEYGLVRSFLARRDELEIAARAQLAQQLATNVRKKVPGGPTLGDEAFLAAIADAYRSISTSR